MATDKSQPRVGVIMKVGAFACVTLLIVHAGLVSYFDHIAHGEEYRKIESTKPQSLLSVRSDEKQRLTGAAMPIDKAMQLLSTSVGRASAGAELMPKPSMDTAPLQGWVQMPSVVPVAMTIDAGTLASTGLDGGESSSDGGGAAARHGRDLDGGEPRSTTYGDAGAAKHLHKAM
jgi:hypothetical protein